MSDAQEIVTLIGSQCRKCVPKSELSYWLRRGFVIEQTPVVKPKAKRKKKKAKE
jgi:hypothetical protein